MSAPFSSRLAPFLVVLSFWIVSTASLCQSRQPIGNIAGKVKDVQGRTLTGATVSLSRAADGSKIGIASTDSSGTYLFHGIGYGRYRLSATLTGYRASPPQLADLAGNTATVDFNLQPVSLISHANVGYMGTDSSESSRPSFSAAGVEGTIAPGGYSAGARAEDTSLIMSRVATLDDRNLSLVPAHAPILSCDRVSDFLIDVRTHPQSFDSNHALGVFYFEYGNIRQSIDYLKVASTIKPLNVDNTRWLALAYLQTSQSSKAIALIQSLIKQHLTDPALALVLAQIYDASGDRPKAIAQYLSAASMHAGEENSFACGIGLLSLGATEHALHIFSEATRRNPHSAKLWMGLGIAQNLSSRKTESAHSLLHAADLDPGYLPTYLFLASLAGDSVATDAEIRKRLEALVVSNSQRAEAHYDYALALSKLGTDPTPQLNAQIEAQLKLAVAQNPNFAAAHLKLGSVYQEAGDYALAVGELERAVQLDPSNSTAHYRLAQAYRRNNQPAQADLELEKFKKIRSEQLEENDSTTEDLHVYAAQALPLAAPCHSSR